MIFAIGKYSKTSALKQYTDAFRTKLNASSNHIEAVVSELQTTFGSEFALHTTWDTVSDMDTHIRMYDAYGTEIDYIWYGHKKGNALTLDKDDTAGKNAQYENYTETSGIYNEGEWFTIGFPNLPEDATRIDISIVAFRGTATTTITLVDKVSKQIVTKSIANLVTQEQVVQIGSLYKSNGAWNFRKANGEVFGGESTISLGEAIRDVSWRNNAIRFIVNITEEIPKDLASETSQDYQYTVSKLANTNAYLINIGNNTNRAVLDRLLQAISVAAGEEHGTFIQSESVPVTFSHVADWIIDKVKNLEKPEDWILVDEEVYWNTLYTDQEHDLPLNYGEHDGTQAQPQDTSDIELGNSWGVSLTHLYTDEKILAEKWRYRHFNNYFDNSTGREGFHAVWLQDPITIFPKPGLYRINYKRKDNPLSNTNLTDAFDNYRYWSTDYDRK